MQAHCQRRLALAAAALCCALAAAQAQFFPQHLLQAPAPGPLQLDFPAQAEPGKQQRVLQHRAVVLNSEAEARLPPQLQNPFYKNPRIEAALAKESWFAPGEQQVLQREADKIPRDKIFDILKHAGLARRR